MNAGGYYPLQIPYLLDTEFRKYIMYREYRVQELEEYCMCIWEMQSEKVLNKTIYNYILPDACIDIVADISNKTICFAGFSGETIPFELNQKIDYMGVRMKPGAFHLLFGISAERVMDCPKDFSEIEHLDSLNGIFNLKDTNERLDLFRDYFLKKTKKSLDMTFLRLTEQLYNDPVEQSVAAHCGYFALQPASAVSDF